MATEEAVKRAVVLPFLQSLGYDVFEPTEVPEFTTDAVVNKIDGEIRNLIECKPISAQHRYNFTKNLG